MEFNTYAVDMHQFTLQVMLPESTLAFIRAQVAGGAFASESDYITELVRLAREASERVCDERSVLSCRCSTSHCQDGSGTAGASRAVEELLREGIESGFAPMTQDDWDGLRRRLEERVRRESA